MSPTVHGRRPITIVMPSLLLVLKSTDSFCQSFVPFGTGAEFASGMPSALSSTMITGGLALFTFSVRA